MASPLSSKKLQDDVRHPSSIPSRHKRSTCDRVPVWADPRWSIKLLNNLMQKSDPKLLCINMSQGIRTGEIQDIIPKLRELFRCSRDWEYFPLLPEDLDQPLQSLLRWLILTFGGPRSWNDFANSEMDHINKVRTEIKRGETKKASIRHFLIEEIHIQFCIDVLHEQMALDRIDGEVHLDKNSGRPFVARDRNGASNFVTANIHNIRTRPSALLAQLDNAMKEWRKAARSAKPDLELPSLHRHFDIIDRNLDNHKKHTPRAVDKTLSAELEAFARRIKKLTAPAVASKITVPNKATSKKSALKKAKSARRKHVRFDLEANRQRKDDERSRKNPKI